HPIAVHVRNHPRIQVLAGPASRTDSEVIKLVGGLRKVSAPRGESDIDPAMAEADDIGHAVAVHVRDHTRIQVLAGPATGADSEVSKLVGGLRKVPVAGGKRHINTPVAEADDVSQSVAVHIRNHARIEVLAGPAAGSDSEVI